MARPLPVKSPRALPMPSAAEERFREEGRRQALDERDHTVLSTLLMIRDVTTVMDKRQQDQGQAMLEMARSIDALGARLDEVLTLLRGGLTRHTNVDPLGATVPAGQNGNGSHQ